MKHEDANNRVQNVKHCRIKKEVLLRKFQKENKNSTVNPLCIYQADSAIIGYGQSCFIFTPHFRPTTNLA